jgi:hypothetical protein
MGWFLSDTSYKNWQRMATLCQKKLSWRACDDSGPYDLVWAMLESSHAPAQTNMDKMAIVMDKMICPVRLDWVPAENKTRVSHEIPNHLVLSLFPDQPPR